MRRIIKLSILAIIMVACSKTTKETEVAVTSISISQPTAEMVIGEMITLDATVLPSNASDNSVKWSSSKISVATVSNGGQVTALTEGSTTITASAGGKFATCQITVSKGYVSVLSVMLNKAELTLEKGQAETLKATINPTDATDQMIIWSSSASSIASVDNSGKVTAVAGGNAIITAKAGSQQATCSISVIVPLEFISLNKTELTLNTGQSETLAATIKPDDATDKTVTWSSSDASVATIEVGKVTAIKEGTATITARAGDKTAQCVVTVLKKVIDVTSVELNKTNLELFEGDVETLTAVVKPNDATEKTVTWETSDPSTATVHEGEVTALKVGTAIITAKAGDKTAQCEVTIKEYNPNLIRFKDLAIKERLVSAFDLDGDGELSYDEAKSVSSGEALKTALGSIKSYTIFDEYQYFCSITDIPASMFEGWTFESTVLPSSIKTIKRYAFRQCSQLKSPIIIQDGVNNIPEECFNGCQNIPSIIIPSSVQSISNGAFARCSSLTTINIPNGVQSISRYAFSGCSKLSSIVIPNSVTKIWEQAFKNCSSLSSLIIPESVEIIYGSAFQGCESLTSVVIPPKITKIESGTFQNCSSLSHIYFPEELSYIDTHAFENCQNLQSIELPSGLVYLLDWAFKDCSSLVSITIPAGVRTITQGLFENCIKLSSVNISLKT